MSNMSLCLPSSRRDVNDSMAIRCVTQVPDLDALLNHVFSDLQQHPDKAEGAGQLLFEMCKGVRNMFHSCAANVSFLSKGLDVLNNVT